MTCKACECQIALNEGYNTGNGPIHRKPQWCIAALRDENAKLAREALEMREALDWIRSDSTVSLSYSGQRQWTVHRRFRGTVCDLGEGATPLESVRNAMGGKV